VEDQELSDRVLREDVDGISFLTLNRPEKLNALDSAIFLRLAEHVEALEVAEDVHCVVIAGAGRSFSAGNDLTDIGKPTKSERLHVRGELVERLANLPQPVVAKIRGHCFTGGLEVALAADLLIGDQSARFADTHGTWGLTPLWGMSQRLPRRVGLANAKRMMFTSRTLSAEEALSIGLIDLCVAPERLDEEVRLLAGSIVANSSFSNRAYKRLLRETDGMPLGEGLRYEREKTPGIAPDALERIRGFKKR